MPSPASLSKMCEKSLELQFQKYFLSRTVYFKLCYFLKSWREITLFGDNILERVQIQ